MNISFLETKTSEELQTEDTIKQILCNFPQIKSSIFFHGMTKEYVADVYDQI